MKELEVKKYLEENGLNDIEIDPWETQHSDYSITATDGDGIGYQFQRNSEGNIMMYYLGGTYTLNNTNEPISMAQTLEELGLNPSGISTNGSKYWFAYQQDSQDTDCGTGTYDLLEAYDWLQKQKENSNYNARICVCSKDSDFCEAEITTEDIWKERRIIWKRKQYRYESQKLYIKN